MSVMMIPPPRGSISLAIGVLAAFFCLVPIFWYENKDLNGNTYVVDDIISSKLEDADFRLEVVMTASFCVAIVPAIDLLLDLPTKFFDFLYPTDRMTEKVLDNNVVRLNEIERFLFIFGIILQSTLGILPLDMDVLHLKVIITCTFNSSKLLILCPIVCFLERTTTTFTKWRTFMIISLGSTSIVFSTISYLVGGRNPSYEMLLLTELVFSSVSGVLFMGLILLCALKFCRSHLATSDSRRKCTAIISKLLCPHSSTSLRNSAPTGDSDLYTNYIPALHMLSSVIITYALVTATFSREEDAAHREERRHLIMLAAEILVLVIELRIRKNEIARGLIALLESKKSYVRYISHELRTPLNTAFLGLKMLTNDLKKSTRTKDVERYDTLCDVNISCMAAVDILNDLLCYEKLESGILELHKENIVIEPFLKDCLSMFSVHAKECGVELSVTTDVSSEFSSHSHDSKEKDKNNKVSLSVLPHDSIYCDKFKMDQVVRNIVSNALKFTPRGGSVQIKAMFVCDAAQDTASCSTEPEYKYTHISKKKVCQSGPVAVSRLSASLSRGRSSTVTSTDQMTGKLVVSVTDTGAGISPQNQNRLFKEIVQFNPEKLQSGGGSGLGLWISGGIINLHDGEISVYSEGEGKGSSFTLELPMVRTPPRPPPSTMRSNNSNIAFLGSSAKSRSLPTLPKTPLESVSRSSPSPPPIAVIPSPTYTLLVVDDSRLNRKMLLKCLRADGHTCSEAADGLEAIAMVKDKIDHANGGNDKPFDAILMDFIMPNMDGPTATQEIRAMGYKAPIFGVTGNGLPLDVAHFVSCGANKVLLKPLDINSFTLAMKNIGS